MRRIALAFVVSLMPMAAAADEIAGTIRQVEFGPPLTMLTVDAEAGGDPWIVDLGPPWRVTSAGLLTDALAPGVAVQVDGARTGDHVERRITADRLHIGAWTYAIRR